MFIGELEGNQINKKVVYLQKYLSFPKTLNSTII
jgi:hypothetical protein